MKKGACHHDKLTGLKRIEGQIRGVQKMIEEGRYCIDILNALGAAIGALKTIEAAILKDHVHACVKDAVIGKSVSEREEKLQELFDLLGSLRR
jgi:DNA-binding FrmR family transcriptional regulator